MIFALKSHATSRRKMSVLFPVHLCLCHANVNFTIDKRHINCENCWWHKYSISIFSWCVWYEMPILFVHCFPCVYFVVLWVVHEWSTYMCLCHFSFFIFWRCMAEKSANMSIHMFCFHSELMTALVVGALSKNSWWWSWVTLEGVDMNLLVHIRPEIYVLKVFFLVFRVR